MRSAHPLTACGLRANTTSSRRGGVHASTCLMPILGARRFKESEQMRAADQAELDAAAAEIAEFERRDVKFKEDRRHCKAKLKKAEEKLAKDAARLQACPRHTHPDSDSSSRVHSGPPSSLRPDPTSPRSGALAVCVCRYQHALPPHKCLLQQGPCAAHRSLRQRRRSLSATSPPSAPRASAFPPSSPSKRRYYRCPASPSRDALVQYDAEC